MLNPSSGGIGDARALSRVWRPAPAQAFLSPGAQRARTRPRFARSRSAQLLTPPLLWIMALTAPLFTGGAKGADLAAKPAPDTANYSWAGCYVGINGGIGASGSDFTASVVPGTHLVDPGDLATVATGATGSANNSSLLIGGQAGCNWQRGTAVFGLEADIDYFRNSPGFVNGADGSLMLSIGDTFAVAQSLQTDFLAALRPRIGIAADRNLFYVTGGGALTRVSYTQSYVDTLNAGVGSLASSKFAAGWTAGAGWEYALSRHTTFRVEYLFAEFPTISSSGAITDAVGGSNGFRGSADLVIQTARAGLNFKF